jgi:acetolactate synthase-1/3 small subunit
MATKDEFPQWEARLLFKYVKNYFRMILRLMLIKLSSNPETRTEMHSLIHTFRCSIIDVGVHTIIVQVIGDREKNDAFLLLIKPYGIIEITRNGETAMARGN